MTSHTPETKKTKSAWSEHPDYRIDIKPCEKPIRIICNGKTIADSRRALLLQEQDHAPVYYFPRQDVRMGILHPTTKTTFCPFKGEANHWALSVGGQHIEVAAWSYENPFAEVKLIKGYIAFYPEVVDQLS